MNGLDIFTILQIGISLFMILDPPGAIPIMLRIVEDLDEAERLNLSLYVTIFILSMLIMFTVVGEYILVYFGISYSALKIAGGLLIGVVGFEMTRAGEKPRTKKEKLRSIDEAYSSALVPLGSPLLVGPGAISLAILNGALYGYIPSIIGAIIASLLTFPFIYFSKSIGRLIGTRGVRVLTRVLGIFILAIGVQYIIDGIEIVISPYLH